MKDDEVFNFINHYHFPIVGYDKYTNKEVMVGTCILLNINQRVFLVTASHVMNERFKSKDNSLYLMNFSDKSKTLIKETIVGDDSENVPHFHDIAIVELNIERYGTLNTEEFWDKCFLRLDRVVTELNYKPSPNKKNYYVIAGYPNTKNKIEKWKYREKYDEKKLILLQHPTEAIYTQNHSDKLKDLTLHLKWNHNNLVDNSRTLPKPQGMSGGGVWLLSNNSYMNPKLYAIAVACIQRKEVISVKMCLVLAIIKQFFPNSLPKYISLPIFFEEINGEQYLHLPN